MLPPYRHQFYNRQSLVDSLISTAESNYQRRGDPQQAIHTMVLIPGGAGIGKSRAGWEAQNLLEHARKLHIESDLDNNLKNALD
ncbi:hypothetical protein BGZ46_006501, partial [Entomortierella lignicola]